MNEREKADRDVSTLTDGDLAPVREAMEALSRLRAAGIAKGAAPLLPPHGGRYALGNLPKQRHAKAHFKMTVRA